MCEFISYVKFRGEILFLTDEDVYSSHGRETLKGSRDNDPLGHGAIRAYYNLPCGGVDVQYKDFWDKNQFPPEITRYLESPETMLRTWGKMLQNALRPDDACYILIHAPAEWWKPMRELLIGRVAEHVDCSYRALCHIANLTPPERNLLVDRIAKNSSEYSYFALRDVANLTPTERKLLVGKVATDSYVSHCLLHNVDNLTPRERKLLVDRIAKNSSEYSYFALRDIANLTPPERNLLVDRIAKNVDVAYMTLCDVSLTPGKRKLLVDRIAKNVDSARYALLHIANLTKEEKAILRRVA